MNYVDKIIGLAAVVNPVERPSDHDWNVAEKEFNLTFPADFKRIISHLGTGTFGDGFYLRNPVASSQDIALRKEALVEFQLVVAESEAASGIKLYPKRGGLVSMGKIDRDMFLFRPSADGAAVAGLVWWDFDSDQAMRIDMTISQFIHDLYFGLIKEDWAESLREYIWREGTFPFFTESKRSFAG